MHRTLSVTFVALFAVATNAHAQANVRPGTDISLSALDAIGSPFTSRLGTYPTGMQAFGVTTTACNVGTVAVPWRTAMDVDHPVISMAMYRQLGDRFEQISSFRGVKHSFLSTNSPGCGPCAGGPGNLLIVGCSDTYDSALNYEHNWLAPPSEIDPWTGAWGSRGSHFDRGFPEVPPPNNTDNVRSPISFPAANQGYRNLVLDTGLDAPGAMFWVSGRYGVIGEPDANRENNSATRQFVPTWTGARWIFAFSNGAQFNEPAIYRYAGATVHSALNASGQDGRFYVAVKVSGPNAGVFHYEYAVYNRDNARQGAVLRIPVCALATITNLWFGDPDDDAGNDWTITRAQQELVFRAPSGDVNNLSWGNLFSFAFDSDASPTTSQVRIDAALAGPGDAFVDVVASAPLDLRNVRLGAGCGAPSSPTLAASGIATLGNAAFGLELSDVAPNAATYFVLSVFDAAIDLGNGCTLWVDPAAMFFSAAMTADANGVAQLSVPIPNVPSLDAATFAVQAVEWQQNGAYGWLDLSNGLKVKLGSGNVGCD